MTRIEGKPDGAGALTRLVLWIARRKVAKLTGRGTERMLQPLEAYARLPRLMLGYGMLEQATASMHHVEERLKVLAELKVATLISCEYCIDIGSQIARRAGISGEQLLALPRYRESEHFDEREKIVLEYCVAMSRTPSSVSEELFEQLRSHFDERQLIELTNLVAVENLRSRFNSALGIGSAGFSEGMVCALPEAGADAHASVVPAAGLERAQSAA